MAHQMSKRAASAEIALAENTAAQRIVTAARRHFFAHGFRGVTMDDVRDLEALPLERTAERLRDREIVLY